MFENQVDSDYIDYIIKEYSDMIIRIAVQNIKNSHDAEDIAQNVFIKLMKKKPDFKTNEHEKAWLIRVTINECKDYLKSAWMRKTTKLHEGIPMVLKEEDKIIDVVYQLPFKYRNVIYLYYYEGYSVSEIAIILSKKENTISSLLFRGRKQLKSKLEGGIYNGL